MENKHYTLQEAKDEVAKESKFINSWELIDKADWHTINEAVDKIANRWASKATEELRNKLEGVELSRDEYRSLFKALQKELIQYYKWENEDSKPPINPVIELKGFVKREEELRKENEALKQSLSALQRFRIEDAASAIDDHNDTRTRLEAEIERLTKSNKELVEALKDMIERMERARNILTVEHGHDWQILNPSIHKHLIQSHEGTTKK